MKSLEAWIAKAHEAGVVAVDTETDSLEAVTANLIGVSLATTPGEACYIPLAHVDPNGSGDGDMFGADPPRQIKMSAAIKALKKLLEDPAVLKVGQNIKYDQVVLENAGIKLAPIDDTMLLSFVLNAGKHGHGMDGLSERYLGHTPMAYKDVCGTGKKQIPFAEVPLDVATQYAAEDADVTLRLWQLFKPQLVTEKVSTVYENAGAPACAGHRADGTRRHQGRPRSPLTSIL